VHELHHGNCLDILRTMPDCSIDAVVTDPPYGLSFMGKRWDYDVPSTEIWAECLRVLKPGGYLLAFAGTRTQHRMAVRIEDAGFEIRDMLAWMYGSGFPKSHNLDGEHQGWGTALKPAMEPITMARKPFKATVAQNVQEWGTGAINIDGCRIETDDSWNIIRGSVVGLDGGFLKGKKEIPRQGNTLGRFPANVMHDGSAEILQGMGEAARFFYTPKACKSDRENGCFALPLVSYEMNRPPDSDVDLVPTVNRNFHPTVKPTDLMRYLCRMVTPTGGIVLDPFTGSGSTGRGAVLEGFRFIGCEMDADYIEIAKARILAAEKAYQPCLIFD
jgi:site-specific DNA-methyltransferase (adenine-specific)